jgi:16S rRNA C967 or C1407 C5-methylase (RsmB/RsmF family)
MHKDFTAYYESQFGSRWQPLLEALKSPERKISWNHFLLNPEFPRFSPARPVSRSANGLLECYILDPASALVGLCLKSPQNGRVLDMCAAPGGKSLVVFGSHEGQLELICNEPSFQRRENLMQVLRQYFPREVRESIRVSGRKGEQWGLVEAQSFDAILVDAPCSGERHLIKTPSELRKWSPSRSKRLAMGQYGLLCSARLALKSGGQAVYSTCALSSLENDGVIEKLRQKKGHSVNVVTELPKEIAEFAKNFELCLEPTRWGYSILPDKSQGAGPIYFTILQKS